MRRKVESFLLAFDTNFAPIVGQQVTLSRGHVETSTRVALMRERHEAGECELVAKLRTAGAEHGLLYTGGGLFATDSARLPQMRWRLLEWLSYLPKHEVTSRARLRAPATASASTATRTAYSTATSDAGEPPSKSKLRPSLDRATVVRDRAGDSDTDILGACVNSSEEALRMAHDYDLIIVGGGIGGSCLAAAVARTGARVLVCERESEFRDRVRGEGMHPWGVAELKLLGMHDAIAGGCGHESRRWKTYVAAMPIGDRDLVETTPARVGSLNFYHPAMQQAAIEAAQAAGAEVRRGVSVRGVARGEPAAVTLELEGEGVELRGRLVVLATGRGGKWQRELGFDCHEQPPHLTIAGVLIDGLAVDEDDVRLCIAAGFGRACITFPLGGGRVRAYVIHQHDDDLKLSGEAGYDAFAAQLEAIDPGLGPVRGLRAAGPLASFSGAARWTDRVHHEGVVLIGDAAGSVDPSFGCGLSLTARDARVLAEELAHDADWRAAADRYSARRRAYYQAQLRVESWMRAIIYTPGPEHDALREVALPRMSAAPDISGLGPDSPSDDRAREALFGSLAPTMA